MLNYRNYFTDFEFWRKQNIKSKKHFKTIMAVMYGKKNIEAETLKISIKTIIIRLIAN